MNPTEMNNEPMAIESRINENETLMKVELEEVLKECMGKKELLVELVRLFKKNINEFITNTSIHLENENVAGVGFTSHKIKSSLKMMRIASLSEIATQMDTVCKQDGDLKHLQFLFNQFIEEYPEIEKAVDAEMKKL